MINVLVLYENNDWRERFKHAVKGNYNLRVEYIDMRNIKGRIITVSPEIIGIQTERNMDFLVDCISHLGKAFTSTRFMLFLKHLNVSHLESYCSLGISAILSLQASTSKILRGLAAAMEKDLYIASCFVENSAESPLSSSKKQGCHNLSKREIEVLSLIAKGYSNRKIASTLYISEKTVKNHIYNIFKKIGVGDRTKAALYWLKDLGFQQGLYRDSPNLSHEQSQILA
jgi:two-component system response regulator DegU